MQGPTEHTQVTDPLTDTEAALLAQLALLHPRPVCVLRLLMRGAPAFGLPARSVATAAIYLQSRRLIRVYRHRYLALTCHGAARSGEAIARFNPVH